MKKVTLIAAVVAGMAMGASAGLLESWEMNDAGGTALNNVANTGSIGSSWNFGGYTTDGVGNLTVAGDGGTNTRKAPPALYATALAGGDTYSLVVDFGAWNMDAASLGDTWNLKLNDSGNTMIANVIFHVDSASTVRIRMASANSNYRNFSYNLTEVAGISAKIDVNIAGGTSEYFINNASQNTFSGLSMNGISQLLMGKGGSWATAASSLDIDAISLNVVPEPATLGLVVAVSGGILFIRRRFMI